MSNTLTQNLLGLDISFPDNIWVLFHEQSNRYGCYNHKGENGLACFTEESGAFRFSEFVDMSGMSTKMVTFEEARQIAKARPLPVIALMLLDDVNNPQIHYVK